MNTEKTSVNWYSHGARYYDPQLALWHSSDPLAELYSGYSPYNYVINNPVNFIDPNGMSQMSSQIHNQLDAEGRNNYYNWEMANKLGGNGRLSPDPNSWNNVGRYHRDLGPGAPITDENGDTYTPYQDPISGMYYYDKEHSAYTEPYYSDEYVRGYSHNYNGSSGNWTTSNYQKAGVVYHSAYTERIYFDPNQQKENAWLDLLIDATGRVNSGAVAATHARGLLELEYIRQARFNRALSGNYSQSIKHSIRAIKVVGKFTGVASMGMSWVDFLHNPSTGNLIQAVANTGLVFVRVNPITGIALGVADVTGASDYVYDKIGNFIDGF